MRPQRHAEHPTGGLCVELAGAHVVCRPAGSLWLEAERTLIFADLHFEKGSAYAARGQMLPPFDTRDTLRRLAAEVAALVPRTLVFLGDSFHDGEGEGRLCAADTAQISALALGRTLVWVRGNHDRAGPARLPGEAAVEVEISGLRLVHEPAIGAASGEVAGHLHPCARLRGPGRSVRRRCFVTDGERMILPAFGAYAGGLNVRDPAFARHMTRPPLVAMLGAGRVHAIGWTSLRGD